MRILYIITQGECGGAQKHVFDIALFMRKNGHQVFVATGRQGSSQDSWLFDSLKEAQFKDSQLFILEDLQREIIIQKDIKSFYSIYHLVRTLKPHIVHVHSTKAGIVASVAARLAGSHIVYTVHGFVFSESLSLIKKIVFITAEFITSFFRSQTIVVSDYDLQQGKKYKILRGEGGVLIYNGLDESITKNILDRESARNIICSKINPSENPVIIGVIANLYRTKGIEYLIEAAKKIHLSGKFIPYFFVIGDGELRQELEEKITNYNLSRYFFLAGTILQAYRFLKAFDLVVLPSTKEGLPYILLEATLAHVPLLATRVGGVMELAKNIPISLVEPANSEALAQEIILNISSIKTSRNKGKLPAKFTTEHMIKSLSFEYEQILKYPLENPICKSFLLTLPAFNEEKIIGETLLKLHRYLITNFNNLIHAKCLKCCVAINGTTDKTEQIVASMIPVMPYLTYTITKERGRGRALFNTWRNAEEDVFLYADSDLAYDLSDIGSMLKSYLLNENYDLVVASRRIVGSHVERHCLRKILTEGYNILIKVLFWNSFTDAQAGCKSITQNAFSSISNKLYNHSGWFFDTAMLLYAEKNNRKIKDITISCVDNRKWRLKIIKTVIYFLKNLFFLRVKTFLSEWHRK